MRYCVPIVCDMCGSRTVFEKEISNSGAQLITESFYINIMYLCIALVCAMKPV